jgi:hypothetical protein
MYLTDTWEQLRSCYGRDGRRVNHSTITMVTQRMERFWKVQNKRQISPYYTPRS